MSIRNTLLSSTALVTAIALTGCDVTKTEDGSLPEVDVAYESGQVPKYEVVQTQEGKMPDVDVDVKAGSLPAYDVETADISIDTKEVDVTVPDVDVSTTEKTVKVPDIDITMPGEDEDGK